MRLSAIGPLLLFLCLPNTVLAQDNFKVVLVAISVRDIDSTASWYHKYLGFDLADKKDFPDYKISVGMLRRNGVRIELVRHRESIPPSTLLLHQDNPALIQGYGKVAYEVSDIEQTVRMMKADSIKFVYELTDSVGKEFTGYRSCIVLDNDGNWVQLYQRK